VSALDVLARARARAGDRAVPIRERAQLSPDPPGAFAIAALRLVSEEHVQAIAYGPIDAPPGIVTRWHPLGRDSSDLEPFAAALDTYVTRALARGELPRLWVPTTATVDLLEMMAHRFHSNREASPAVQLMGKQLRALVDEASIAGQQVVGVARTLLADAVATGQSAAEDAHLGALLAWIRPDPARDPAEVAAERALAPAAAMLERSVDDEVEKLRKEAKRHGRRGALARARIERLLERGAQAEWDLLVEARSAYHDLSLPADHLDLLVDESMDRLRWTMQIYPNPGRTPTALLGELDRGEHAIALVEDLDLADYATRERARRKGHVFDARVMAWDPADPRRNGFEMQLHVAQEILRARRGTAIRVLDGKVRASVLDVAADQAGGYRLTVKVTGGVRSRAEVAVGTSRDWTDSDVRDLRIRRRRSQTFVKDQAPDIVYGELPAATPRALAAKSLIAVAEDLRR
jgi:hypothetical protein